MYSKISSGRQVNSATTKVKPLLPFAMGLIFILGCSVSNGAEGDTPSENSPTTKTVTFNQLRAKRDELQSLVDKQWALAEQNDPLLAVADERRNTEPLFNPYALRVAINWLVKQENTDKDVSQKQKKVEELYSLREAIRMLDDRDDAVFLHTALTGPSNLDKDIFRHRIEQDFPTHDSKELADPETLWRLFTAGAATITNQLDSEIADLPKTTGWPEPVVRQVGLSSETYVRKVAYLYYIRVHLPPDLYKLQLQLRQIQNEMNEPTQPRSG